VLDADWRALQEDVATDGSGVLALDKSVLALEKSPVTRDPR